MSVASRQDRKRAGRVDGCFISRGLCLGGTRTMFQPSSSTNFTAPGLNSGEKIRRCRLFFSPSDIEHPTITSGEPRNWATPRLVEPREVCGGSTRTHSLLLAVLATLHGFDPVKEGRQRAFHGVGGRIAALVGDDEHPQLILRHEVEIALRARHAAVMHVVGAQLAALADVPEIANAEVLREAHQRLV